MCLFSRSTNAAHVINVHTTQTTWTLIVGAKCDNDSPLSRSLEVVMGSLSAEQQFSLSFLFWRIIFTRRVEGKKKLGGWNLIWNLITKSISQRKSQSRLVRASINHTCVFYKSQIELNYFQLSMSHATILIERGSNSLSIVGTTIFFYIISIFLSHFSLICCLLSHNRRVTTRNLATWMEKWNWTFHTENITTQDDTNETTSLEWIRKL